MNVITWGKPEPKMTSAQWKSISADGAPPGVYTRNEAADAKQTWWGKVEGTRKPPMRVILRYTTRNYVYLKIVVYETGLVHISANGTAEMTREEAGEMGQAIAEAFERLGELQDERRS